MLEYILQTATCELNDDLHMARLLILISASCKKEGKSIEGITKLAKMDFLLRYPICLRRVLVSLKKDPAKADLKKHELTNIENKMIRFRYGPWDPRYRRWIGLMVSKRLVTTYVKGKTIHIELTGAGREAANNLTISPVFSDYSGRSALIAPIANKFSAVGFKDFIYKTFPELLDMKWGQEIIYET